MPTAAEILNNASAQGAAELNTALAKDATGLDVQPAVVNDDLPMGTGAIYDDSDTIGVEGIASASNLKLKVLSGEVNVLKRQRMGQKGTAIYNPKREDIEVEKKLGEKRYNAQVEPDSNEELIRKNKELAAQYETLAAKVELIVAGATGATGATVAPVEMDYKGMDWAALVKFAKERGVSVFHKNREQLIAELG